MKEYFDLLISFIVGGGLMGLVNLKLTRKAARQDLEQKAVLFWQGQANGLMERLDLLESQVKELLKKKCDVTDCKNRI